MRSFFAFFTFDLIFSELEPTFIKQPHPRDCFVCFQHSCIQFTPSTTSVCIMNIVQTQKERYINFQVIYLKFLFNENLEKKELKKFRTVLNIYNDNIYSTVLFSRVKTPAFKCKGEETRKLFSNTKKHRYYFYRGSLFEVMTFICHMVFATNNLIAEILRIPSLLISAIVFFYHNFQISRIFSEDEIHRHSKTNLFCRCSGLRGFSG